MLSNACVTFHYGMARRTTWEYLKLRDHESCKIADAVSFSSRSAFTPFVAIRTQRLTKSLALISTQKELRLSVYIVSCSHGNVSEVQQHGLLVRHGAHGA